VVTTYQPIHLDMPIVARTEPMSRCPSGSETPLASATAMVGAHPADRLHLENCSVVMRSGQWIEQRRDNLSSTHKRATSMGELHVVQQ